MNIISQDGKEMLSLNIGNLQVRGGELQYVDINGNITVAGNYSSEDRAITAVVAIQKQFNVRNPSVIINVPKDTDRDLLIGVTIL